MSKSLTPSNDRVLIKPIDEGEQTYGSIVIPDMGKEKPEIQIVLVPKIGTLRIDFEGEEYYIAQDKEILAVIKETENE